MNNMPKELKEDCAADPFYKKCCLAEVHECKGRITWEHAMDHAGKQLQEKWAIVPICEYFHLGAGLNKKRNKWVALNRATEEDFNKYPKAKAAWIQQKLFLNKLFGVWKMKQ